MKKVYFSILLSVIFLFTFASTSIAQFRIYAGAGANVSTINIESTVDFNSKYVTNYFVSVRPEYRFSNFVSFSFDAQYSVKGTYFQFENPTFTQKTKLGFIDIIPQIGLKLLPFIEVYGGVGLGIKTSELIDFDNKGYSKPIVNIYDNDYSVVAGARIKVLRFVFHGQFSNSISNFNDLTITDSMGNVIKYNEYLRNFQLGVAYQIF